MFGKNIWRIKAIKNRDLITTTRIRMRSEGSLIDEVLGPEGGKREQNPGSEHRTCGVFSRKVHLTSAGYVRVVAFMALRRRFLFSLSCIEAMYKPLFWRSYCLAEKERHVVPPPLGTFLHSMNH